MLNVTESDHVSVPLPIEVCSIKIRNNANFWSINAEALLRMKAFLNALPYTRTAF
jgi:hypothetical protein